MCADAAHGKPRAPSSRPLPTAATASYLLTSPTMPRKPRFQPTPPDAQATAAKTAGRLQLSPEADQLYRDVDESWQLTPPVRALLRIACEALTKAADAEAITAREGMSIGDGKGAAKPHPMALLARDYRAQAASTLQRILSNLGAG